MVVFIGRETEAGFIPLGTALIGARDARGRTFAFLATAKHLFDILPDPFSVRLNAKSGEAQTVEVEKMAFMHKDPNNDLAVIPFRLMPDVHDVRAERMDRAHHEKEFAELWAPGIGDEVAVVGLYTSHYGLTKNIPVVRIGHIAAMPEEPVRTGSNSVTSAYLVEVKSIQGLSGSPVFLNPPQFRVENGQLMRQLGPMHITLGIMIGYHLVESAEDQIIVPQVQGQPVTDQPSVDERNTGFAVVVPIERVYDIFEAPPLAITLSEVG
jgi:hypothetical protein